MADRDWVAYERDRPWLCWGTGSNGYHLFALDRETGEAIDPAAPCEHEGCSRTAGELKPPSHG